MKPQRIQLKRTKGFNLQAVSMALNGLPAVKCARPGTYSNPFVVSEKIRPGGGGLQWTAVPTREDAIECFRLYVGEMLARDPKWLEPLRGKNLACFCAIDRPCHCDVLLELANNEGKVKP